MIITLHSVLPVRAQASEQAEQETQLLFGETAQVLETTERWLKIKAHSDGSEGWVDRKMTIPLTDSDCEQVQQAYAGEPWRVVVPVAYALSLGNGQTLPLAASTRLPNYHDGEFEILGAKFHIDPSAVAQAEQMNEQTFLQRARLFLNSPYLWGGKNPFGYDCSGFVQVLYSFFGLSLPRNASQQVGEGQMVDFLAEARLGDLAFFDHGDGGAITHVGILLDNERILHCSGRVKVDRIDPNGIIDTETKQYSHNLRVIKRVIA